MISVPPSQHETTKRVTLTLGTRKASSAVSELVVNSHGAVHASESMAASPSQHRERRGSGSRNVRDLRLVDPQHEGADGRSDLVHFSRGTRADDTDNLELIPIDFLARAQAHASPAAPHRRAHRFALELNLARVHSQGSQFVTGSAPYFVVPSSFAARANGEGGGREIGGEGELTQVRR